MTISLVVRAEVNPEKSTQLMSALKEVASASLKEAGCLQFDILTDQEDPRKLMLYEVYSNEAASKEHQQTAHFKKFMAQGVPLFAKHDLKLFNRAAP